MQIKVFKASSMKEAVAQMKQELGENAVILHTKKYKDGGFLGVGSREMIELTAAIEDEKLPPKKESIESPKPPPMIKRPPSSVLAQYKTSGTAQGVARAERESTMTDDLRDNPPPRKTSLIDEQHKSISEAVDADRSIESAHQTDHSNDHPNETESFDQLISEATAEPPIHDDQTVDESAAADDNIDHVDDAQSNEAVAQTDDETARRESSLLQSAMETASNVESDSQPESAAVPMPEDAKISEALTSISAAPSTDKSTESASTDQASPPQSKSESVGNAPMMLTAEQFAQMQAQMMAQMFAQMQAQMNSAPQPAPSKQSEPPPPEPQRAAQSEAVTSEPPQPQSSPEPVQDAEVSSASQEKISRLENEIAQMKTLLAQVLGRDMTRGNISLHELLRQQEVNEEILNDMAVSSGAGETLVDSQSNEARYTLTNYLKNSILFTDGIKLNRHGVRIVALLGTTGVGKTTTLAKIAAKFVLEHQVTAALITADTYRISAVEQLRTYSDILGLPLEIVYSPAELSKAISKHRSKDLILIDTAGRSQHNNYQMKELQELLTLNQRIEKHLVISTTTKQTDARAILEKFAVCEPDKLIFTKTDETSTLGLILNLLCKQQKLGLSYFTNGQSVPDDIITATPENLAALLFGNGPPPAAAQGL